MFHADGGAQQPFFADAQLFGLGYPYLVLSGLAFAFCRWGGKVARLRKWAEPLRAFAFIPGFIFVSVSVSGLLADALKVLVGRTRPKLLFASGTYDFTWFGLRADHWSFPSGHATTVAALATALWCLWPRPVWLYAAAAAVIAVSRVVTGEHFPSDVIAGAAIGVVATRLLASWLLPRHASAAAAAAPDAHNAAPASHRV